MPVCPNCGVELDESARHCPLCRCVVEPDDDEQAAGLAGASFPEKTVDPEQFDHLTDAEKRKAFLEVFAVCVAIVCVTLLAVELLVDRRISWSLYPIASVLYLYVLVSIPVAADTHRWRAAVLVALATPLYILALDLLDPTRSWFLVLGGPIVLIVEGSILGSALSISRLRYKGVNAIAIALVGAAAGCVGLEAVTDLALQGSVALAWSAVVAVTCLPVAGLLFYLHHRITRRASLKKLFHL